MRITKPEMRRKRSLWTDWAPMFEAASTLLDYPGDKEAIKTIKAVNEGILQLANLLTGQLEAQYAPFFVATAPAWPNSAARSAFRADLLEHPQQMIEVLGAKDRLDLRFHPPLGFHAVTLGGESLYREAHNLAAAIVRIGFTHKNA